MQKLKYFQDNWDHYSRIINTNFLFHTEIKELFKITIENYLGNLKKEITISDFGCGDCSQIIPNLANKGVSKFIGIDATVKALNSAENNLKLANLITNYELKLGKIEDCDLLLPDNGIDIIYLCYSLHHLSKIDKITFLYNSYKKLVNNGIIFIADGILNENTLQDNWINLFETKMIEKKFTEFEIKNMIDHCKNEDYHEYLSFYQKTSQDLGYKGFNILFKSELTTIFTLTK